MSIDVRDDRRTATNASRADLEALLGETFAAVRREAFAYCLSILKDPSLAEDAVQSAFVEIARRIRSGDAQFFAAAPWDAVKRNLRWASLKQRREMGQSDRWFAPLDGDPAAPADGFAEVEGRLVATHILDQLPDHMRTVLHLRAVDDAPDAVSAARLGISIDAFRCRYKRAVSAARAAARGLGIEGTAGAVVAVVRRRWGALRSRWLRGADRGAAAITRLASVAGDNLLRVPSLDALGTIAVAVLAAAAGPAAGAPVPILAAQLAGAGVADQPPHPVGAESGIPSGASAQRAPAPVTEALAPPLAGLPALAPGSSSTAASETPEDTTFFTATAAASSGSSDWIVALGWGKSCQCAVLFQSRDGGGSWAAAAGPPGNTGSDERIALPPSYPADPRIFLSAPAQLGTLSYTASRFGARFVPLPVPNGTIAVSPLYDRGDDRIFIAGQAAVWTYSLDTRVLQPVAIAGAVSQIIAIATPPQPGAVQLDVLADSTTPAAALAGSATQPTLFACSTPDACAYLSTPPLLVASSLAFSPGYATDRTLAVSWVDRVAVSHDGGQSFTVSVPAQGHLVTTFVSAPAHGAPQVWAVDQAGNAATLVRLSADGGSWLAMLHDGGGSSGALLGATASGGRVIALPAAGGLQCSADGGATWAPRCPAV